MECEKFETLLMDELYGELDEVTSAAVRRHAAGCSRCGALLSGLRATRKVATLPVEQPSSDLEDRILSAVREQQKVLPLRSRMSTVLSRAGAWAMQPQTAMAAVLLLVIGTSFVLVQSRKSMTPSAGMTVAAAEGAPVQAMPTTLANASAYALDGKEAAFAHGIEQREQQAQGHTRTATAEALLSEAEKDKQLRDEATNLPMGRAAPPMMLSKNEDLSTLPTNAGPIGGAGGTSSGGDLENLRGGGGGGGRQGSGAGNSVQTQAPYGAGGVSFGSAKQAYDQQRYDDAKKQWDVLAPSDPNAALWAARAEKASTGCTANVIQRYEQVRARAGNTSAGNDATRDVAQCYRANGDVPTARARLSTLLSQQGYASAAQSDLDAMSPAAAARKAAASQPSPRPVATTTAAPTTPTQKAAADRSGY